MVTSLGSPDRKLYRWQLDALVSWLRCGRRGVIEAVTGSGKTEIAIAAASDALRRGRFVLVLVPSRVLMEQWHVALRAALPDAQIGRLGDDGRDTAATCDVLVATRHSAAAYKPIPRGAAALVVVQASRLPHLILWCRRLACTRIQLCGNPPIDSLRAYAFSIRCCT